MPELARLAALARGFLPPGTAVAAADPTTLYPLLSGEALPGAVPARLREFSAGRHAARSAMAALGAPVAPLPQGDDRAPVWPDGLCGTITHTARICLAAVTRTGAGGAGGIGLDLEPDEDLPADLWDSILLPPERAWALAQPLPGRAARLVFSAKEAAYKAQYARSLTVFGFDTLAITATGTGTGTGTAPGTGTGQLTATFQRPVGPFGAGTALSGRHALVEGHHLTAFFL